MTAKVILNPYSNRWNAKARWPETEAALKKAGVNFDLVVSEYKGHIVDLAKEAVRQKFSPIIVVGGDGSIGDTVNGMARGAEDLDAPIGPLGIMPVGSANDLVSSLGIPAGLEEAAQVIAAGKTKLIDLGKTNRRYFANNSAIRVAKGLFSSCSAWDGTVVQSRRPQDTVDSGRSKGWRKGRRSARFCARNTDRTSTWSAASVYQACFRSRAA